MATRMRKTKILIVFFFFTLIVVSCKEMRKKNADSIKQVDILQLASNELPEDSCSSVDDALLNEVFDSWLSIDINQELVIFNIGEPVVKDEDEYWGATGMYVQEWHYLSLGLTLEMESEDVGLPKKVLSILITSPSSFSTNKGIHIGSGILDVRHKYSEKIDATNSDDSIIVVGSIYGGLIFYIENGYVVKIFIGAAAE